VRFLSASRRLANLVTFGIGRLNNVCAPSVPDVRTSGAGAAFFRESRRFSLICGTSRRLPRAIRLSVTPYWSIGRRVLYEGATTSSLATGAAEISVRFFLLIFSEILTFGAMEIFGGREIVSIETIAF
jgi:hypothetical protein